MSPMASRSPARRVIEPSRTEDLARLLVMEAAKLEALLDILRQEQEALLERDFERIYALALVKNEHLAELGALGDARAGVLRGEGLSPDPVGMKTLLAGASALQEPWRRVQELAEEARRANRVNGTLISVQMRFVEGALALLQRSGARFATYGADGHKLAALTRRSLASA